MRRALAVHLLALAFVAGHLPMVSAVYDCSMSGARSLSACCCSSMGGCPDAVVTQTRAFSGALAELRASCCSVSHERHGVSPPTVRTTGDEALKELLVLARGIVAFETVKVCDDDLQRNSTTAARIQVAPPGRAESRPLFIVHRALLI